MKKSLIFIAVVVLETITVNIQQTLAQTGMDYAGIGGAHYSRLRRATSGIPFLQNQNNEKAIGVYTQEIPPLSALEVNTDFTHIPNYLTLWYNRGEVFRTDCPAGETPFWRMFRGGTPVFNINNPTGSNDINLTGVQNGNMNFLTTNTQRMTILGNNGYVGIGTNLPQSQLHINDGTYATFQMTNATTGANATDGFRLAVNNQNQVLMAQFEESPIRFFVNDNAPGNILTKERMRITTAMVSQHGNLPAPVTRVSISNKGSAPISNPVSLLHMGEPAWQGYRSWMDVGTYIGYHTDNMYVGMFDRYPYMVNHDITDAVINWGDDYDYTQPLPNTGPDDLLFIFTDNYSSTVPSIDDKNPHSAIGAEVARMTFRGFFGSMGICTPNPKARLHITASNPDQVLPYAPDHRLQMRLSFDIRSNTDFRVLEKNSSYSNYGGNLLIIPWYNELVGPGNQDQARNVGIGLGFHNGSAVHYPKRRLDVWDDTDPQLRLSCILDNDPTVGIYTDIQTTNTNNNYNAWSLWTGGHLLINPRNNGKRGTVAIDMEDINTPANLGLALDVNGQQNIRTVNQDDGIDKVLVWDDSNTNNGHGRVLWRDASTLGGGGADFDWFNQATLTNVTTTVDDDLYTNGNVFVNVPTTWFPSMNDIRFAAFQNFGVAQGADVRSVGGWFCNVFNHSIIPPSGVSRAYGVRGQAIGGCGIKSFNYGGYFEAYNAENNFAGYFVSDCNTCNTNENYGIYASVPVSCGVAVWVDGNLTITGTKSKLSDARFKTNVNTITSALNIIEQLNPVTFDFTTQPELSLPSGNQFGLIAQEVELVLPNVVTTEILPAKFDSLGNMVSDTIMFKGVNYEAFIPILIASIKTQQTQIDSMQQVINSIVTQMATCCDTMMDKIGVNTEAGNSINVELASKGAILYQNTPNPFGEGTAIRYFIPDGVNDAKIVFYDEYGNEIKNVPISDSGNGQLNVNSMNLASGIYTYSLVINDKIADTKKMVRTK